MCRVSSVSCTTPTGQPQVDGDTLASLPYEPCPLLCEHMELTKIMGMLADGKNGWLKLVKNGRLHGRVITCGAVTGRCTHSSPNLAQIPAHGTYGPDCRSLFHADRPGWVMVGADASGLELRMLAHYLARTSGYRRVWFLRVTGMREKRACMLFSFIQWVSAHVLPILYSPVVGQRRPKWRPDSSMASTKSLPSVSACEAGQRH